MYVRADSRPAYWVGEAGDKPSMCTPVSRRDPGMARKRHHLKAELKKRMALEALRQPDSF